MWPYHFSLPRTLPHTPSFAVDYLKTSRRIVSNSRGLHLINLFTVRAVVEAVVEAERLRERETRGCSVDGC